MKNKKNMYKVPENTVRVITNVEGMYDISDYSLEELATSEHPSITVPISDDMAVSENTPCVKVGDGKKAIEKILNSMPIDPFIPYAMTTEPGDRFMERTELGVATVGSKRLVTECSYEDDIVRPLMVPAIVGDQYGPLGMFIPFNACKEALGGCAELFTDLYNNYENSNSTMNGIVDYTHNPKYKKLPF